MTAYLDMNATSPVSKEVADLVYRLMVEEYGNAGSRTHEFGALAKKHVETARKQVAEVVAADKSEVIFTSGATESNNIAILGIKDFAEQENKKHIITTRIEHKAVLEPIEHLENNGFEVSYLDVGESGLVDPKQLNALLRDDTVLVSIMHVNNETGCIQPMNDICEALKFNDAYLHVDAAQSFGKLSECLKNDRVDLISASGHKVYAPKGIGALIMRKRGFIKPPLKPIQFGGGQEKGLRPGTLPVPLIAGFGLACELAIKNADKWQTYASLLKQSLMVELDKVGAHYNGENTSPYVLNFSVSGVNSESLMVSLKGIAAVSNGSACTSSSYTPSHVLTAMGLDEDRITGAVRISWGYMTESLPINEIVEKIKQIQI
ncbi:cysteine desulfurase [Pseudoalteromonas luteoviolacea]|uniref:cysteine desulfurase n=1 Tax=Pseudoalteromonas luteoviolacea TaxID=43657 RepID=A0A0C1MHG9_9GAMM|nr:cysteine desulfurase DndA [Pseudoalteromonas luteoviolacea]KID55668.1 cysteine desulfurase [Pseudoalteromonas luteoviolacea]KID56389.1 cysteine desulfurase [Pseudoalteromonas luteoviolacea]